MDKNTWAGGAWSIKMKKQLGKEEVEGKRTQDWRGGGREGGEKEKTKKNVNGGKSRKQKKGI